MDTHDQHCVVNIQELHWLCSSCEVSAWFSLCSLSETSFFLRHQQVTLKLFAFHRTCDTLVLLYCVASKEVGVDILYYVISYKVIYQLVKTDAFPQSSTDGLTCHNTSWDRRKGQDHPDHDLQNCKWDVYVALCFFLLPPHTNCVATVTQAGLITICWRTTE